MPELRTQVRLEELEVVEGTAGAAPYVRVSNPELVEAVRLLRTQEASVAIGVGGFSIGFSW